jgi:hypothetical protein
MVYLMDRLCRECDGVRIWSLLQDAFTSACDSSDHHRIGDSSNIAVSMSVLFNRASIDWICLTS